MPTPPDDLPSAALPANLVHFVRHLRSEGLPVGPGTAADLVAVINAVGLDDRTACYHGFLAVVTGSPAEREVFDEAFARFFGGGFPDRDAPVVAVERRDLRSAPPRVVQAVLAPPPGGGPEDLEPAAAVRGASDVERLARRDFADLDRDEQERVRRIISQMVWSPADARSRRVVPSRTGATPDLRRSLRAMTGPHGDLMPLAWSDRKPRRRPLIVLADISGSMERYTEMFLTFIHAAQGRLGRVEAFVFATELTRITRQLRRRQPSVALESVGASVTDWSGGTRIGESLATFNRQWSRRVTRGGAVALIISDGWDTGDPALLAEQMARFARSVHRVVWLNPLAGRPGFAPETLGMRAVLPHVDDLLAAGNLTDLRSVVALLEQVPPQRRSTGVAARTRVVLDR